MALTIWKYPISLLQAATETGQRFMVPVVSVLSVQVQPDATGAEQVCLWALVDTNKEPRPMVVWVVGTGMEVSPVFAYSSCIGTVQFKGGTLVLHVFVRTGAGV